MTCIDNQSNDMLGVTEFRASEHDVVRDERNSSLEVVELNIALKVVNLIIRMIAHNFSFYIK